MSYTSAPENAGIAQLVERNLAKVEVESSRLFSRSNSCPVPTRRGAKEEKEKQKATTRWPFFVGAVIL